MQATDPCMDVDGKLAHGAESWREDCLFLQPQASVDAPEPGGSELVDEVQDPLQAPALGGAFDSAQGRLEPSGQSGTGARVVRDIAEPHRPSTAVGPARQAGQDLGAQVEELRAELVSPSFLRDPYTRN
ncbi:hypothetical protein PTTG_07344 [Puccinia triticina 1-1 BBBD Race 1]|uniref:Uncharacterized protein n=2 Tax=Puccinia triticina TaxID=208348 RepID=A0A0C4F2M3_PUCT1|nr:uncharacterized protein PtA15_1A319 [Puccinia triticina]OAV90321.1 hypothetical protein PTTG_07344 [Puccinia triticina 1-1 BBBD Race 1]WAQ80981.1 hypothetical protein PtA15_1A319 [Puccinia triticina]WAR51873.1 hypothetical protein PtB15_1B309 [Puccinia triticina]